MSFLQTKLASTQDAHAGEVGQLSADRDALAKQCAEQRTQCEQQSGELEAVGQQLTDAMEGEKPSSGHYLTQTIRCWALPPACRDCLASECHVASQCNLPNVACHAGSTSASPV